MSEFFAFRAEDPVFGQSDALVFYTNLYPFQDILQMFELGLSINEPWHLHLFGMHEDGLPVIATEIAMEFTTGDEKKFMRFRQYRNRGTLVSMLQHFYLQGCPVDAIHIGSFYANLNEKVANEKRVLVNYMNYCLDFDLDDFVYSCEERCATLDEFRIFVDYVTWLLRQTLDLNHSQIFRFFSGRRGFHVYLVGDLATFFRPVSLNELLERAIAKSEKNFSIDTFKELRKRMIQLWNDSHSSCKTKVYNLLKGQYRDTPACLCKVLFSAIDKNATTRGHLMKSPYSIHASTHNISTMLIGNRIDFINVRDLERVEYYEKLEKNICFFRERIAYVNQTVNGALEQSKFTPDDLTLGVYEETVLVHRGNEKTQKLVTVSTSEFLNSKKKEVNHERIKKMCIEVVGEKKFDLMYGQAAMDADMDEDPIDLVYAALRSK